MSEDIANVRKAVRYGAECCVELFDKKQQPMDMPHEFEARIRIPGSPLAVVVTARVEKRP